MSKRALKRRAHRNTNSLVGTGILEEYLQKVIDTKTRLDSNFVAYVSIGDKGGVFICGGDVEAAFFRHPNFFAAYTGYSSSEVTEVKSVINSLASRIRSLVLDENFHETIVVDFMSSYLKETMEDPDVPKGLAVEMILVDFSGTVHLLYNTGDNEEIDPSKTDQNFFIVGCYNEKLKGKILNELKKLIDPNGKMNDTKAAEVIVKLRRKFKLAYVGFQVLGLTDYKDLK